MQIVVVGGGYAGLAALLELRTRLPRAELTLVDPEASHLKITQLHRTLRKSRAAIEVDFAALAERHTFTHLHAGVATRRGFGAARLARWQRDRAIVVAKQRVGFDALVIATGAHPIPLPESPATLTLTDIRRGGAQIIAEALPTTRRDKPPSVTVVGGGATGVQFLFELGDYCRERRIEIRLRLVNADTRLLQQMPAKAHDYVLRRMREAGYEYLGDTQYVGQKKGKILVREAGTDTDTGLESALTLLFPGVSAWPSNLPANRFGQALVDGAALPDVYLAGDCARFEGSGLDTLTAQAAVRKGKHVAMNIARAADGLAPLAFGFRGLGFMVSMGPFDAVGWMLAERNVVTGLAAYALSEAVEKQYDLFVSGIDTYLI